MPTDTISETTIRRRENAERKRVKEEKDNGRKAKKIKDLTDIGTERSPACESCLSREVKCIVFPPNYNFDSTSHLLRRLKLNNKCSLPVDPKMSEALNMPQAPRILGVKRHVFAVHTAPCLADLVSAVLYADYHVGVKPKFEIAEFTRPSRCALCIVDESTAENISRSCTLNDDEITHAEHEASLPIFTGNVPLLWDLSGLEKPTPAPLKCTNNKSSTCIPSPLESEVIIQYPLESADVQERLDAIDRFVDYTLVVRY
ncbi:hypothetical protein EAF00_006162 [Botryotinia globosa]|nr:hypothetical protein EAF00_006162 [Botryotinia globosa]